eukprot:TRINITY_DN503491_c0_g1_i1.p1 TRINITY_DN503491_c0_g1~~TRINITY_DN503491_c0_g1_i1.p1  ORF type:complete len:969 (-),score=211.14 TRINITY_DN503491_c0_g1_i1:654-3560(-)
MFILYLVFSLFFMKEAVSVDLESSVQSIKILAPLDMSFGADFNWQVQKAFKLAEVYVNKLNILPNAKLDIDIFDWSGSLDVIVERIDFERGFAAFLASSTLRTHDLMELNEAAFFQTLFSVSHGSTVEDSEYTVRTTISTSKIAKMMVDVANKAEFKRVAVVGCEEQYSLSFVNDVKNNLADNGINVALEYIHYSDGSKALPFADLYDSILESKAKIILLNGLPNFLANVLRYGIERSYIGSESDGSIVFIISGGEGCDRIFTGSDKTIETLKDNLNGHICVDYSVDIDEYFLYHEWYPNVGSNQLSKAEKEGSGLDEWKGADSDNTAAFAWDTVLWIAESLANMCVRSEKFSANPSDCYEYINFDGRAEFLEVVKETELQGVTGTIGSKNSNLKEHTISVKNFSSYRWLEFGTMTADNEQADLSGLSGIFWPDLTNTIPSVMRESPMTPYEFGVMTVFASLIVVVLIMLAVTVFTKSRLFFLGLFNKKRCLFVLLCCFGIMLQTSSFFIQEPSETICVVKFYGSFLSLVMNIVIVLGLYRFHEVLLNKKLSKVNGVTLNLKTCLFIGFFFAIHILRLVLINVWFGNPGEVLHFHDPTLDKDEYWTVCKLDIVSSLGDESYQKIIVNSKILTLWVLTFISVGLVWSTISHARSMLKRTRRYHRLLLLRNILLFSGMTVLLLWSSNLLSGRAAPQTQQISDSSSEKSYFDNSIIDVQISDVRRGVLWNQVGMLFCCLIGMACVGSELQFLITRWRKKVERRRLNRKKSQIIFTPPPQAVPPTSENRTIDKRYNNEKLLMPDHIVSFVASSLDPTNLESSNSSSVMSGRRRMKVFPSDHAMPMSYNGSHTSTISDDSDAPNMDSNSTTNVDIIEEILSSMSDNNEGYFSECNALVAYMHGLSIKERANFLHTLKTRFHEIKGRQISQQRHVNSIENKLSFLVEEVEILRVRLRRVMPKVPNNITAATYEI